MRHLAAIFVYQKRTASLWHPSYSDKKSATVNQQLFATQKMKTVLLLLALVLVVMASTEADTLEEKYTRNYETKRREKGKGNLCTGRMCVSGTGTKPKSLVSVIIENDREALIMGVKLKKTHGMCTGVQCLVSKSKVSKFVSSAISGDVEALYRAVNTLSDHVQSGMESEDEQVLNDVHALLSKAYSM